MSRQVACDKEPTLSSDSCKMSLARDRLLGRLSVRQTSVRPCLPRHEKHAGREAAGPTRVPNQTTHTYTRVRSVESHAGVARQYTTEFMCRHDSVNRRVRPSGLPKQPAFTCTARARPFKHAKSTRPLGGFLKKPSSAALSAALTGAMSSFSCAAAVAAVC